MVKKLLAHFTPCKRGVKGIGNQPPEIEKLISRVVTQEWMLPKERPEGDPVTQKWCYPNLPPFGNEGSRGPVAIRQKKQQKRQGNSLPGFGASAWQGLGGKARNSCPPRVGVQTLAVSIQLNHGWTRIKTRQKVSSANPKSLTYG